jgi:pyridoxamine 5'-phosphate oxidase family protein
VPTSEARDRHESPRNERDCVNSWQTRPFVRRPEPVGYEGETFSAEELAFLQSQPLARLATTSPAGQPDVVPVALEYDGESFWVGGPGPSVLATRKFRNVTGGQQLVAIVVDDLISFDPFVARGIRIYGRAEGPIEREGIVGQGQFLRITPTVSWSWNMAGAPVGEDWYPARRTVHE